MTDLIGDGTSDFILVTEKTTATLGEDADSDRTLVILTRDAGVKLKLAKSYK